MSTHSNAHALKRLERAYARKELLRQIAGKSVLFIALVLMCWWVLF